MFPTRPGALGVLLFALAAASAGAAPRRAAAPAPQPAPQAPPGPAPDEKRILSAQARIEALIKEIEPNLGKLGGMHDLYTDGDLEALDRDRAPLIRDIEAKREALRDLLDDFKTLRKEFQFRQGAAILSAIAGGASVEVQDSLRRVMDYDNYPKEVSRFRERVDDALRADRDAFAEAQAARESAKRRKEFALYGGVAAAIFSVLVAAMVRRARRRRRETLTAVPVRPVTRAGEPLLAGGPPTPAAVARTAPLAALSGPAPTPIPRRVDPAPGAILGGSWRVLAAPSTTPLGPVFDGEEASGKRPVLIRRVRDELHRNEKDLDRFLERARQVASLKHINLCEVYAVFVEDERVHIVVERVDGRPVSAFLEPGRRINLASVKRVLIQVAKVLDHAHQAKVLHGDLTPQNILVTRDGMAKVADFGIGIEARKIAARLSWSEPVGSPAYLAPEQELGAAFKESDVFSLGVILYEMTTGVVPFEGPNFLAQKRERSFKPPSQVSPGLPKELDAVIAKALAPEPQHRYRSAADFAAAIEKLPDQ